MPLPWSADSRGFEAYSIDGVSSVIEAMVYGEPLGAKTPIFILNSHEFFGPPSKVFCDTAWDAGYQVILIRRPGIVGSTPLPEVLTQVSTVRSGAAVAAEAAILSKFITQHVKTGAVVLSLGGSNPVAYRLTHFCKQVGLFVFANPTFNQNVWGSFSPDWFRRILEQVIASKSGVHVSSLGIKHFLKRDPLSFYRQILAQSAGDLEYLKVNEKDFIKAGALAQTATTAQLHYELSINFQLDPLLKPGVFNQRPVLVVSGAEANASWVEGLTQECRRLSVPLELFPSGFIFGPYHAPDYFFELVKRSVGYISNNSDAQNKAV